MPISSRSPMKRDELAVWMAALMSVARTQHGIMRMPVSRLKESIRHLADSGTAPELANVLGQDGKLAWFDEVFSGAQDLGLQAEDSEPEAAVSITIEQAKKVLKWIDHSKGMEYTHAVESHAKVMADYLNAPM